MLEAAIRARCHYVDVSGEQAWIRKVHDSFGDRAAAADITLLPAATDDGVSGDLIASLVAGRISKVDQLRVHGYFDATMS